MSPDLNDVGGRMPLEAVVVGDSGLINGQRPVCYMMISFNTPDAVWYAPAPAPWITSGDG